MDDEDRRKADEWIDHQAEVAGVNNGRASRFLDGEDSPRNRNSAERKARERAFQNQLDQLLLDPVFAAAYERVGEAIDNAQVKLNAALDIVAARIEHLQGVIGDLESDTAKLPDGIAVFRDADGNLVTADGRALTSAETQLLLNPDNIQSYNQYKSAKDALDGARAKQEKLTGAQTKIDDARERRDEAQTPDELDDIEKDVGEIIKDIEAVETAKPTFDAAAFSQDQSSSIAPTIKIDPIKY